MLITHNGSPAPSSAANDFANLDTLRAFAVLAVLADHLILTLNSARWHNDLLQQFAMRLGRLGVVAFFVHTCLVLMFSLERVHAESRHPVLEFYLRRAFRIYPLSILTVLLVSLLQAPELPLAARSAAAYTPANIVFNLLLVQNVFGSSVIGPLWSLPYEVLMYLVLPPLFLAATRARALRIVAGMMLCAALFRVVVIGNGGPLCFADFLPCFLSGVFAYVVRRHVSARLPASAWVAVIVAVLAIGSAAAVHWWPWQVYIGWLAGVVFGASVFLFRDCANPVWNTIARYIATYSYGIYLLHVPVLWIVFKVLGITSPAPAATLSLALTAAAAMFAYHGVERPMIRRGKQWCAKLDAAPEWLPTRSEAPAPPSQLASPCAGRSAELQ